VALAYDGEEAVQKAEALLPEIILMDVAMPRLNGLDATRRIRSCTWGRDIRVIAVTGWGQESDRARTAAVGCDGHLVKPVDLEELTGLLAEFGGCPGM
jgi:CheY-like chemotaxis protein